MTLVGLSWDFSVFRVFRAAVEAVLSPPAIKVCECAVCPYMCILWLFVLCVFMCWEEGADRGFCPVLSCLISCVRLACRWLVSQAASGRAAVNQPRSQRLTLLNGPLPAL